MYVDLTMPVDERTPLFPGDRPFEQTVLATIATHGWNSKHIAMHVHFGTHVDAPLHMRVDGKTLDAFSPADFIAAAGVIDVRGIAAIQPGHIPDGFKFPFALLWTGHSGHAHESAYFKDNPVLTLVAANKLAGLGVRLIGIDSFTVDNPPYEVHKALFSRDILILENLVNLDQLGGSCRLYVLPLNLQRADGAPARVIAEIP